MFQRPPKEDKPQHWSSWVVGPGLILGLLGLLWYLINWQIAFFVLCILIIILIHEFGHFFAARRTRMKVTEFFLGFGPKLWSVRRKGILYGIRAIPAGAFVKIPGMYMIERDIDKDDEPHCYRQKSFLARISVALAGPMTHFVAAILIFFLLFSVIGFNGIGTSNTELSNWSIREVQENSPASRAGLLPGDKIIQVNGMQVDNWEELVSRGITPNPGRSVSLLVERGERTLLFGSVALDAIFVDQNNSQVRPGSSGGTVREIGRLGIVGPDVGRPRVNPILGIVYAFRDTGEVVRQSIVETGKRLTPGTIGNFVSETFNPTDDGVDTSDTAAVSSDARQSQIERDENRFVSVIGVSQIGGQALEFGLTSFLLILALFNIFLGLINLLPVLPFDGGHVSIAVYEEIRSRRLNRRYYADISKMQYIILPILVFLIFISFVAIIRDVTDPFNI